MRLRMPTLTPMQMQTPPLPQKTPRKAPVQRALVRPRLRWAQAMPWRRECGASANANRASACERNWRWNRQVGLELGAADRTIEMRSRSTSAHGEWQGKKNKERTGDCSANGRNVQSLNVNRASSSITKVGLTFEKEWRPFSAVCPSVMMNRQIPVKTI